MTLSKLLEERFSARGFQSTPVAPELQQEIFRMAQNSPSNCNVQPWQTYVLSGQARSSLSQALIKEVMEGKAPEPDFNWKVAYEGIHRERQFGAAHALYSAMGVARDDKLQRNLAMLRNWTFFDAPHVVIFTMDKYLDIMGAVDIGIYAQTLALLLKEHGIDSCMQGALGQFPKPFHRMLNLPEGHGVLFGMSFGYADESPANQCRTNRADITQSVTFLS